MNVILKSLRGPRLYHICQVGPGDIIQDYSFEHEGFFERYCSLIIDGYDWLFSVVKYLSPFIVYNAYKHGVESYIAIGKVSVAPLLTVYFLAFFLRGTSRYFNPAYVDFIRKYNEASSSNSSLIRSDFLRKYNFDFSHWTPDFKSAYSVSTNNSHDVPLLFKPFYYFMATWIGKPLIYPGATYPINAMMSGHLNAGRVGFMSTENLYRAKLEASDGNHIDTLFVDNRNEDDPEHLGNKLFITSEGNAAFCEVGCFELPLKEKYSALGWNHPGFAFSTGVPFAEADGNAIEAVYDYAINKLGFAPKDIFVYGWSIGGFATSYIVNSHPDIGGAIIDASFDDVMYLAGPRMPEIMEPVTKQCVRKYFNLNNAELLKNYHNPIRVIRRKNDELMSPDGRPRKNRGNWIMTSILESRYPALFLDPEIQRKLEEWLEETSPMKRRLALPMDYDIEFISSELGKSVGPPDSHLGEGLQFEEKAMLAYYLFSKHFTDVDGSHNSPLPKKHFKMPWKKSDDLNS